VEPLSAGSGAKLQNHFGEFLVAEMLLIAAIFTTLVYKTSDKIVAEAK